MSEDIITQLQEAPTDEQKAWAITALTLKGLPPTLATGVMAAAIPHWFDASVLAALLAIDIDEAEGRYSDIKMLAFSEPFGALGYSLHDLTRAAIVSHLLLARPEDFQRWIQRAYEYFGRFGDEQNTVEALYHLLTVDKELGTKKFTERMQSYIDSGNFSAANNLGRNVRELVKYGRLDGVEYGEVDVQYYLLAK